MTVYHSEQALPDPATSGHIPAVRRRRRALRLAVCVVALLAHLLLVEAYTNGRLAPDGCTARRSARTVPAAVRDGGPVIDAIRRTALAHYRMPSAAIALTFDDGPDPWTPRILDVLRRHRVHGDVLRRRLAGGPAPRS